MPTSPAKPKCSPAKRESCWRGARVVVLDASITPLESTSVDVKVAGDDPVFTIAKPASAPVVTSRRRGRANRRKFVALGGNHTRERKAPVVESLRSKKVAMVTCADDVMRPHPTAAEAEEPPAVIITVLFGGRMKALREPENAGTPSIFVSIGTAKGVPSVLKKSADAVTVDWPALVI